MKFYRSLYFYVFTIFCFGLINYTSTTYAGDADIQEPDVSVKQAECQDSLTYDEGIIIPDNEVRFIDIPISVIQTFLETNNSFLCDPTLLENYELDPFVDRDGNGEEKRWSEYTRNWKLDELKDNKPTTEKYTPAQIIYLAAKENNINPIIMLSYLQKEQSLIEQATGSQKVLDRAVGYGMLESGDNPKYYGFLAQMTGLSFEMDFEMDLEVKKYCDAPCIKIIDNKEVSIKNHFANVHYNYTDSLISAKNLFNIYNKYRTYFKDYMSCANNPIEPDPEPTSDLTNPNLSNEGYHYPLNPFVDIYGDSWYECTRYAFGRAYEKTGTLLQFSQSSGRHGGKWYDLVLDLSRGSEPQTDSLAVWDYGTYGHVAYVEKVNGNNITFTEANWPGYGLYNGFKTYTKEQFESRGSYEILGYIYLDPIEELISSPTEDMIFLKDNDIMKDQSQNANLSRYEAWTMIFRSLKYVLERDLSYEEKLSITNESNPELSITRQELLTMIIRALKVAEIEVSLPANDPFTDTPLEDFRESILKAYDIGIIDQSWKGGAIHPTISVPRHRFAEWAVNMIDIIKEKGQTTNDVSSGISFDSAPKIICDTKYEIYKDTTERYLKFHLSAGNGVSIVIKPDIDSGYMNFYVYDVNNFKSSFRSETYISNNKTRIVSFKASVSGIYFIKITGSSGIAELAVYNAFFNPGVDDNNRDFDATIETAKYLSSKSYTLDNLDKFYRFECMQGDQIKISLTAHVNSGHMNFYVYDNYFGQIKSATISNNKTESVSFTAQTTGIYFLKVNGNPGNFDLNATTRYDVDSDSDGLSNTSEYIRGTSVYRKDTNYNGILDYMEGLFGRQGLYTKEWLPGDMLKAISFKSAESLPYLDMPVSIHFDGKDRYIQFENQKAGNEFSIAFKANVNSGHMNFYVYDNYFKQIKSATISNNKTEIVSFKANVIGIYFIKITGSSGIAELAVYNGFSNPSVDDYDRDFDATFYTAKGLNDFQWDILGNLDKYYRFECMRGDQITIALTAYVNKSYMNFYVYDNYFGQIRSAPDIRDNKTKSVSFTAYTTGIYFLKVNGNPGNFDLEFTR